MKNNLLSVSVIIPCRNEEKYIERCLNSILENDYPKDKLEIIIADGGSTDRTKEIISIFNEKYPFIKLLNNLRKITPAGLNIGIKNSKGEIIMIMSAHGKCASNYISTCVKYLLETNVDAVGGLYLTLPRESTFIAYAIALALSSPFGVGNAHYRVGIKGNRKVDTVAWGCYRKEIFGKAGLFDEEFESCEDDEFNYRLREKNCELLLTSETTSYYYARTSLKKLWKQYMEYGIWKVCVFQKHPRMMQLRQFVPVIFILSILLSLILSVYYSPLLLLLFFILGSYLSCNLFFTFKISKEEGWKYFLLLPVVFATLHFSYGIGLLIGLIKFFPRWFQKGMEPPKL